MWLFWIGDVKKLAWLLGPIIMRLHSSGVMSANRVIPCRHLCFHVPCVNFSTFPEIFETWQCTLLLEYSRSKRDTKPIKVFYLSGRKTAYGEHSFQAEEHKERITLILSIVRPNGRWRQIVVANTVSNGLMGPWGREENMYNLTFNHHLKTTQQYNIIK